MVIPKHFQIYEIYLFFGYTEFGCIEKNPGVLLLMFRIHLFILHLYTITSFSQVLSSSPNNELTSWRNPTYTGIHCGAIYSQSLIVMCFNFPIW